MHGSRPRPLRRSQVYERARGGVAPATALMRSAATASIVQSSIRAQRAGPPVGVTRAGSYRAPRSHVLLDGFLQRLRLGAANAHQLLLVLPEVEGWQRAHSLTAHELVRVRTAIAHDLEEGHVLVLLAELVEFGRNDFARAAPRGGVVHDDERVARGLEGLLKLVCGGNVNHHSAGGRATLR